VGTPASSVFIVVSITGWARLITPIVRPLTLYRLASW
jgi:hypothetical protein